MRYFVSIAGRELAVDIVAGPDGVVLAALGERQVELDLVSFSARELSVRIGGRVMDLTVEGGGAELGLVASGRRTYVRVESERMRTAARAARTHGAGAEREVKSPMPGRVVKVLVGAGEEVTAGQAVAIVEAMKMENEVRARQGGVVDRVHVAPGVTVEANAPLVSFA